MDPLRGTLLWASGNATLREHLPRFRAVRKTVERFMPGETADDGLAAAERLASRRASGHVHVAGRERRRPLAGGGGRGRVSQLLDRIDELGMDAEVSVKLTQLGFDLEPDGDHGASGTARRPLGRDGAHVWIDMESVHVRGGTVDLYGALYAFAEHRAVHPGVPAPDLGRHPEARCRPNRRSGW